MCKECIIPDIQNTTFAIAICDLLRPGVDQPYHIIIIIIMDKYGRRHRL